MVGDGWMVVADVCSSSDEVRQWLNSGICPLSGPVTNVEHSNARGHIYSLRVLAVEYMETWRREES